MSTDDMEKLKRLTIVALVSDDRLMNTLVLKGGNALSLVHDLRARASFDLDFSMEGDFAPEELDELEKRMADRLKQTFAPENYTVFDIKLEPQPSHIVDDVMEFWGGYSLEFKLIASQRFAELDGDIDAIRREAIPPRPGGRARFKIDISKCEHCAGKKAFEMDEFTVYVYTPAMIVCEKIRAICQQAAEYAAFVGKNRAARARDFFDIRETVRRFKIDVTDPEILKLIANMFHAKRVPLASLRQLETDRDFHRQGWDAVRDTVDPRVRLRDFDYYFEYVHGLCLKIAIALDE